MQSRPNHLLTSIFPYYGAIERPAQENLEEIIERETTRLAQDDPPRGVLFTCGTLFTGGLSTLCVFDGIKKNEDLVFLGIMASLGYVAMVMMALMAMKNFRDRSESQQRLAAAQNQMEELENQGLRV